MSNASLRHELDKGIVAPESSFGSARTSCSLIMPRIADLTKLCRGASMKALENVQDNSTVAPVALSVARVS